MVINDDGTRAGCDFKAVQIGGPSGGCLTQEHLDLPIDYENLKAAGAMVGSGGLVVMNQQTCMVSIARFFMQFTQNESCGKCVVCREGTKQMLALLDDIIEGLRTKPPSRCSKNSRGWSRKDRSAAWEKPRPIPCCPR